MPPWRSGLTGLRGRELACGFGGLVMWRHVTARSQPAASRPDNPGIGRISLGPLQLLPGLAHNRASRNWEDRWGHQYNASGRSQRTAPVGAGCASTTRGSIGKRSQTSMLGRLGRASDLILLQVRPENAGSGLEAGAPVQLPRQFLSSLIPQPKGSSSSAMWPGLARSAHGAELLPHPVPGADGIRIQDPRVCRAYDVTFGNAYEFLTVGPACFGK